jgi:hypothetical protein
MATSSKLENLAKIGQLKAEPPAQTEIDGLVSSGRKRLDDARNPANALESRFELAYNAAHARRSRGAGTPQARSTWSHPAAIHLSMAKKAPDFVAMACTRGCRDLSTLLAPPTG